MREYTVVDLETTGLEPETAKIVEWSMKRIGGAADGAQVTKLVNPECQIPVESSAIHQICDDDVKYENPIEGHVSAMLNLSTRTMVAHNADFEKSFLERYLGERVWICTWKCALIAFPDAPSHGNEALRYHLKLGENLGRGHAQMAHSAAHDVKVTSLLFLELAKHLSHEEMVRISSEPAQLITCPIGKHRGEKWADIPLDYLQWLGYKAQDMRREIVICAQREMARRADASKALLGERL